MAVAYGLAAGAWAMGGGGVDHGVGGAGLGGWFVAGGGVFSFSFFNMNNISCFLCDACGWRGCGAGAGCI